ncbi:EamA family transporter [Streptomyces sp. NPDC048441]|uniref:EamA family transporter n=1 Tax=Streptomyces sp. NPDC048441 TaxID=3365552 RepID=UPI003712A51D
MPFGLAQSGDKIVQPHALAVGLLVALLSAALPYSLELTALRRLPVRVVGVLQSLEPVAAGMAGLLLLQERLSTLQWLAIGLITAASAGAIAAHTGSHPPRAKQELTGGTSQSGHRLVSKPSSGVGTRSGSRASTRTRP